jgi:UDP-2-acetamido-2,6-beta-L-arabino-hexul-4-ose reductase
MVNILVTGAKGFVGKNLCVALRQQAQVVLYEVDLDNSPEELQQALRVADVVFHLAGVNRPKEEKEYQTGNAGFTSKICSTLETLARAPKIVFSSSIQAELGNPYGASKLAAEEILRNFAAGSGSECVVYRLKNLFGKWCRPNYNAVTATFCYNAAHDLPLSISDPSHEIELTYIDNVVEAFLGEITESMPGFRYAEPLVTYWITLGELAETIQSFRQMRSSLQMPDFSQPFVRALYASYVTYLDQADFAYPLTIKTDKRGSLAEFIKAPGLGQVFVSRTRPGITRGNHYHHTKGEKFLVLEGEAVIRFRHILGTEEIEYRVRGDEYRVVDIPPGYTHSIQNVGAGDLVTLFWADEIFDPQKPDTTSEEV